ncbi:chymotrypsin-2-like [Tenebrio molitor]|uniref:chymotrypsin-2-like n=1 Tax=Tenebrio molitor TaxID=7067 RepID=UPI003624904F
MFTQIVTILLLAATALGSPIGGRIVNGTDAQDGDFPSIVSVRFLNSHNCGGSILNERYILTAAHCVVSYPASFLSVQYDVTTISSDSNAPNVLKVSSVIYNKDYTPGNGYINDVAVLKLQSPIIFGTNARPIKLPVAFNSTPENSPAELGGWGLPYSGGTVMTHLQIVNITVFSDDECERIHAQTGPTSRKYHVCAGVPQGGKGQCNGDSGGPLVVNGVQVGIVSWSVKPCTVKGYPGVFTKVSSQVPWILEQIGGV